MNMIVGYFLEVFGNFHIAFLWMFLGICAAALNKKGRKQSLCLIYVIGLLVEWAVGGYFTALDILESEWRYYYLSVLWIDIVTFKLMQYRYHRDYDLITEFVFIMIIVNATIVPQWDIAGSDYMHSQRVEYLGILNWMLLFVLYWKSDGCLRIMDSLRDALLEQRIRHPVNFMEPDSGRVGILHLSTKRGRIRHSIHILCLYLISRPRSKTEERI